MFTCIVRVHYVLTRDGPESLEYLSTTFLKAALRPLAPPLFNRHAEYRRQLLLAGR